MRKITAREISLRKLRREINDVELEISLLNKNIDQLEQKTQVLQHYLFQDDSNKQKKARSSKSPVGSPASKNLESLRKEVMRALSSDGILSSLGLKADSTAEELVSKLEGAALNGSGSLSSKLRHCLSSSVKLT